MAITPETIIQLKERYRTLSEMTELFPRKGSNHKIYKHIDKEMRIVIYKLDSLE
jgi:hypothetical protein